MPNTAYITLTGQQANLRRLEILSDNASKIGSAGFQAYGLYSKSEAIVQPTKESISMPMDYGTFRELAQGPLGQTGNDFDVAINGKGYFSVTKNGQNFYTRNGQFTKNENGELVTTEGNPVQDTGGGNITLPEGITHFEIHKNGDIETENGILARLKLVGFEDEQDMTPIGNGLFSTEQAETDLENPTIMQRHVEGSNVNPVQIMVDLVNTQREFERSQNVLNAEDERLELLLRTILA